jgi:hypothetical protein
MTYTVRIPGKAQPVQMEFAVLKYAYADKNIPGTALVTLEHQDFWYSLAELMGDKPAKPLLFPCPKCKQMIRSRAIDRGNEITCSKCHSVTMVPNPAHTRARAAAATEKARKKPMFWAGLTTTVIGTGLVFYPVLFPDPGVRMGVISFAIIGIGIAMMMGKRIVPGPPHEQGPP